MTREPLYELHAAPEAIQVRLNRALARQQEARLEVEWLVGLLARRLAQKMAGTWPPQKTPTADAAVGGEPQ